MYYYFKGDQKVGPYTLQELQSLQLPLDAQIWCDGWEKSKSISECSEVVNYLLNNAPAIPILNSAKEPSVENAVVIEEIEHSITKDNAKDNNEGMEDSSISQSLQETIKVHPELHWLPKTLMILGIIAAIGQIGNSFKEYESPLVLLIALVSIVWAIVSIGGMLSKTKWGLISYLIYRSLNLFLFFILAAMNMGDPNDLIQDFFSFIVILLIFLIKKDGYNVYQTLLNNGTIIEPIKKNTDIKENVES